jgi:hypothetical protein
MAQTLSFTHNPVSGLYEAEFQIEKAAVLHVERAVAGRLKLGVRTTGAGKYALVDEFEGQDYKSTIDAELMGEIYPKWVKVSSESEPTYGEVVSEGEVTEIKSQSKEVEVTANGTMDITPDAGFSYLSAVKVKTNVPTSGEGGASGNEYDGYYLLDWKAIHNEEGYDKEFAKAIIQELDTMFYLAFRMPSGTIMTTTASIMSDEENWWLGLYRAMRWKRSDTSLDAEIGNMSPKDLLTQIGAEYPLVQIMANRMTECTKEEFYNLNA